MSGRSSVRKGKDGERAVAQLLREQCGLDARRRVRQHSGDSDITGIPGWSIEVKQQATARLELWWQQAVAQAAPGTLPLLAYRLPRRPWRFVWPVAAHLRSYEHTCEGSAAAWAEAAGLGLRQ
jgi:Holliday junction resolvase